MSAALNLKYNPTESPQYPHDNSERRAWLRERGWRLVVPGGHENERWQHPDFPERYNRTQACRLTIGLDA